MLSAHAVLYRSKVYKEKVIEALNSIIGKAGYHSDVAIARLQRSYRIYGYYFPFFYQSSKLGNHQDVEDCTRFSYIKMPYGNGSYELSPIRQSEYFK